MCVFWSLFDTIASICFCATSYASWFTQKYVNVSFANEGFMESFTFKTISGNPQAFHELDQAVVTKTYAQKFFGNEDPLGKVLTVFDDNGISFNYIISGVVEKPATNSSVRFDILLNFENRYRMYNDVKKGDWANFTSGTFLYFKDPTQAAAFEPLLSKYVHTILI